MQAKNPKPSESAAPETTGPEPEPGGPAAADTAPQGTWNALWHRYRAHLKDRYRRVLHRPRPDVLPAAMRAARPLVIAEALIVLLIGFSLDDLHVLRVPGFLAGIVGALVVLVFGGVWHGSAWADRLGALGADRREAALDQRRTFGRAVLTLASFVFLAWLVVFSSGVPPWA